MTTRDDPEHAALELAEELYAAISMLRRRAARSSGDPWSPQSLTGAQLELMKFVRRQPLVSVAAAAAELGLVPNTVSTLVRQLVDEQLLERVRDDTDGRVIRLRLTPAALQSVMQWNDQRSSLTAAAICVLDRSDRAALARAVSILAQLASSLGRPERP